MLDLPTGTVTLLFTDVEGSTHLLQQLGDRYADMLSICRHLLRQAFDDAGGNVVDTQGDAFFVAFARATDAVSAAVAGQRALARHSWPEGVTVRARMGLHTGEPELTSEGYIGLDVHHAARIMNAAHGGQILLSATTRSLVEHELPADVYLQDLGEHRLKDLQRPTRLFQIVIADLPADYPPLKTLDAHPHNLPVRPTPLIGREREVAAVGHLLQHEEIRLVTLTGQGGVGKTRLGLQVAAELTDHFSDGVYFVNLAPISDSEFVLPTIAQTLTLKETGEQSLLDLLKTSLRDKQLLLLLDNFEQVVSAASLVADLLAACPKLKFVVTSREVLHVRGEQEFAVPPLAVPDPKRLPDLVALSQYEAVALFISRAQAVKPDFQVTSVNAPAVAEICTRLDGLPLSIELAAARIKLLPPQALLVRLGQRLQVLTSGSRDAPVRQQSLRNTLAWSYGLLNAEEQRLFRRLSVFVGGCTLEAIEAVCTAFGDEAGPVLDAVASLIDKSLLQQLEQEDGEPRLVMLETIREYGLECLVSSGEEEVAQQAHATYYMALVKEAEPKLGRSQQITWLEQLEREHDNLRAVLSWSVEQNEEEMALRLGGALLRFWEGHGHLTEGRNFLERVLTRGRKVTASVRAKALYAAGILATQQGDNVRAEAWGTESLALYRELGNKSSIPLPLYLLGLVAWRRGDLAAACSLLEEDLAISRELGQKGSIAWALSLLGRIATDQGEYMRALSLLEESLTLFRETGDKRGMVNALFYLIQVNFFQDNTTTAHELAEERLTLSRELGFEEGIAHSLLLLGQLALSQGETAMARRLSEESVALFRKMEHRQGTAQSLSLLGKVITVQGDPAVARALYEESLALARKVNDKLTTAFCLEGLADVAVVQGESAWAVRLWGAAEALRQAMGAPLPPIYRATYERSVAAARAQLGEQVFTTVWAEGHTTMPEQVLGAPGRAAVSTPTSAGQPAIITTKPSPRYPAGLSAREVEVLRLVAQGLTNEEVAEQLVISPRTVNTHLTSIYGKIGVSTRSAATRYAIKHNFV